MFGWLVGWLVSWLVGWLVGWWSDVDSAFRPSDPQTLRPSDPSDCRFVFSPTDAGHEGRGGHQEPKGPQDRAIVHTNHTLVHAIISSCHIFVIVSQLDHSQPGRWDKGEQDAGCCEEGLRLDDSNHGKLVLTRAWFGRKTLILNLDRRMFEQKTWTNAFQSSLRTSLGNSHRNPTHHSPSSHRRKGGGPGSRLRPSRPQECLSESGPGSVRGVAQAVSEGWPR